MELRAVTAGYGGADVVKGISLRFQPGEVTVLAGPNGCGKSTLLRAAARLLPLRGGQVLVDGVDTAGWSSRAFARQAALLPQSRPVPEITVEALVLHGRFPYLGYPRRYGPADRAAWGTSRPTKPTSPAKLTAAPHSTAARVSRRFRAARADSPRDWATSSPRVSRSSS